MEFTTFTKIDLPYSFDALEPYIDAQTMQIHYEKHHQAYCDKLNLAIEDEKCKGREELMNLSANGDIEHVCKTISKYSMAIRNNAGGVFNHNFFWQSMIEGGTTISNDFVEKINEAFGSFNEFITAFSNAAVTQFGSGWAWLCKDKEDNLFVTSTANQDNPLMDCIENQGIPLLGLDVWEHAYYLKYQNRRPEYVENFFNIVNWEEVERRYRE